MMPQQRNVADSQQQQQQWMIMQYPAATMVVQHPYYQMIPHQLFLPQSFTPYPLTPHHQHQSHQGLSFKVNRTIWVGDLHYWMEENYLQSCFAHTGEVTSIKVIRDKQTGHHQGFGFVEFYTRATAEKVLQTYNGTAMPNRDQPFRLNWVSSIMGYKCSDVGSDRSIFVGDASTGRSKGYDSDYNEGTQGFTEMNGAYCSSRTMRIGVLTPRKSTGIHQISSQGMCLL
ncbi:hypothetical protein MKW98_016144 [Papaver atlanticum]|uniref:RRM domain-containing protein n=1 Tax=Papaver atlanticum TaxID=357466 RepID=A0AAD4S3A1_9MAGN|nr:hypothetical protein MKW98_016144 [Papaver atlanticum]